MPGNGSETLGALTLFKGAAFSLAVLSSLYWLSRDFGVDIRQEYFFWGVSIGV
jgi:hypothetical protein